MPPVGGPTAFPHHQFIYLHRKKHQSKRLDITTVFLPKLHNLHSRSTPLKQQLEMKYSILVCAASVALTNAFVISPKTLNAETANTRRIHTSTPICMATDDSFDSSGDDETPSNTAATPGIDAAWRHVKKPMLRIGGKGTTETHGNSLRELLNAHTAVKVKVNTHKLGSLEDAFEEIKALTEKSGKIKGIELIHVRPSDNMILFGLEGTLDLINAGDYPPPPPPPYVPGQKKDKEEDKDEDKDEDSY